MIINGFSAASPTLTDDNGWVDLSPALTYSGTFSPSSNNTLGSVTIPYSETLKKVKYLRIKRTNYTLSGSVTGSTSGQSNLYISFYINGSSNELVRYTYTIYKQSPVSSVNINSAWNSTNEYVLPVTRFSIYESATSSSATVDLGFKYASSGTTTISWHMDNTTSPVQFVAATTYGNYYFGGTVTANITAYVQGYIL